MIMARFAARFLRHFSNIYRMMPLKNVLRNIASPLPMPPLYTKKEA